MPTGKRLIDGPAGMWCVNVGHRREELAKVMYDQAMALSYNTPWYTMNAPSAELAMRIADHAPGDLSHVFFTTGGSSAVETALRFMQFYNNVSRPPGEEADPHAAKAPITARPISRPRSTAGRATAISISSPTIWCIKLSVPDTYRRPEGMSEAEFCDLKVAEFRDKIARARRREGRLLHRRASHGIGRRHRAAQGLSAPDLGGLPQI